jgi:hypothetical protein
MAKSRAATMHLIDDMGYWRKPDSTRLTCGGGADCFWCIYRKVRKDAEIAKKKSLNRAGGSFGDIMR